MLLLLSTYLRQCPGYEQRLLQRMRQVLAVVLLLEDELDVLGELLVAGAELCAALPTTPWLLLSASACTLVNPFIPFAAAFRTVSREFLQYPFKAGIEGFVGDGGLPDQLFQPPVLLHAEPNPADAGVTHRHAQNPVHVERASRKQTAHMRHGAGVILDGTNAQGGWVSGLEIRSNENTIMGLQVVNFSGAGIALRPRDMAKLGVLMLQRGTTAGRSILPSPWIDAVTGIHVNRDLSLGAKRVGRRHPTTDVPCAQGRTLRRE